MKTINKDEVRTIKDINELDANNVKYIFVGANIKWK
jgi:hypothetical protein